MTSAKSALIFLILALLFVCSCAREPTGQLVSDQVTETNQESFYYFDYTSIDIQKTAAIDLKLKNLNLYVDIYGNLVILGELENESQVNKSDVVFTFDFLNSKGQNIFSVEQKSKTKYLLSGQSLPFCQYVDQKDRYIEIATVKIGVNYKNFYERFSGNPVVQEEKFYYQDQYMIVEGQLINLGMTRTEDLVLLATFYNQMGKVVFIRECYIPQKELGPQRREPFKLKILLDQYLPEFTSYSFSVFFKDSIKVGD